MIDIGLLIGEVQKSTAGPGHGRLETEVVAEIAKIVAPQKSWFVRNNETVVIEQIPTGFEYSSDPNQKFKIKSNSFGFRALIGLEAKHRIEEFLVPGMIVENEQGEDEFQAHSFTTEFCNGLVLSPGLVQWLPPYYPDIASSDPVPGR